MKARLTLLIALASCLAGCEKQRTPERYLIPSDFEGVVITVFEQEGFPELPSVDGFRVHRYPEDGVLITSSKQEFGWAADEILDVLPDGTTRRLSSGNIADRRVHFAGTGETARDGVPTIDYRYKAVGTVEFWKDKDAREWSSKADEAAQKLMRLKKELRQAKSGLR